MVIALHLPCLIESSPKEHGWFALVKLASQHQLPSLCDHRVDLTHYQYLHFFCLIHLSTYWSLVASCSSALRTALLIFLASLLQASRPAWPSPPRSSQTLFTLSANTRVRLRYQLKGSTMPRGWIGVSKKPKTQTQCGSQKSNRYYQVWTGTTGNYRKYRSKPPVLPVRQEKLWTLK